MSTDWKDHGNCVGSDPDVFFDDDTWPAKVICADCPVRTVCLDYAVANRENWGVWGGTTAGERRRIRRHLRVVS